jgi:hypothetical protein
MEAHMSLSHTQLDAERSLARAREAQDAVQRAGRWLPHYLALFGLFATVWILALETVFSDGAARGYTTAAGGLLIFGLSWWAESHAVLPRGTRRLTIAAVVVWFGAYLFLVGPLVRWQVDTSFGWWALASVLLASPFFVAAGVASRRA